MFGMLLMFIVFTKSRHHSIIFPVDHPQECSNVADQRTELMSSTPKTLDTTDELLVLLRSRRQGVVGAEEVGRVETARQTIQIILQECRGVLGGVIAGLTPTDEVQGNTDHPRCCDGGASYVEGQGEVLSHVVQDTCKYIS